MAEVTERIGQLIRETRKAKGLTQRELGEKLGISESTVNKYENDSQNLTIKTLERVADALGVRFGVFFE